MRPNWKGLRNGGIKSPRTKLMRTTIIRLASLGSALLIVASAALAISPEDKVKRSNAADRNVSYRGTKTTTMYSGRNVQARMKVTHLKPDNTRIEYTAPGELAGIVTIDKGNDSWRYLPKKGEWEHQKWDLGEETLTLALRNYNVVDAGSGSVAGRPAYVVKIVPKSKGIPSQTLWIDKQTYLVLKSEVRGPSGSLRSSSSFSDIDINPRGISSGLFSVRGKVEDNNGAGSFGFTPVKPDYLPRGYVLVGIAPVKVDGGVAAHLQYTNGINTISIFQKRLPRPANSSERVEKKPNGITIITSSKGRISFTVIGDISQDELMRVAKSLR